MEYCSPSHIRRRIQERPPRAGLPLRQNGPCTTNTAWPQMQSSLALNTLKYGTIPLVRSRRRNPPTTYAEWLDMQSNRGLKTKKYNQLVKYNEMLNNHVEVKKYPVWADVCKDMPVRKKINKKPDIKKDLLKSPKRYPVSDIKSSMALNKIALSPTSSTQSHRGESPKKYPVWEDTHQSSPSKKTFNNIPDNERQAKAHTEWRDMRAGLNKTGYSPTSHNPTRREASPKRNPVWDEVLQSLPSNKTFNEKSGVKTGQDQSPRRYPVWEDVNRSLPPKKTFSKTSDIKTRKDPSPTSYTVWDDVGQNLASKKTFNETPGVKTRKDPSPIRYPVLDDVGQNNPPENTSRNMSHLKTHQDQTSTRYRDWPAFQPSSGFSQNGYSTALEKDQDVVWPDIRQIRSNFEHQLSHSYTDWTDTQSSCTESTMPCSQPHRYRSPSRRRRNKSSKTKYEESQKRRSRSLPRMDYSVKPQVQTHQNQKAHNRSKDWPLVPERSSSLHTGWHFRRSGSVMTYTPPLSPSHIRTRQDKPPWFKSQPHSVNFQLCNLIKIWNCVHYCIVGYFHGGFFFFFFLLICTILNHFEMC